MRGPQAWSDCATGYAFQAGGKGEQWKDVVLYNGNYYSCVKSHTKTASNYPGSTTAVSNGYWQLGDKIELVATKILLATYALVKNLGVEVVEAKDGAGNIIFQAKDGNVTCVGNITAKSLMLSAIPQGGKLTDGSFLRLGWDAVAPELPDGKISRVEYGIYGPRTRVPVYSIVTAENSRVSLTAAGAISESSSILVGEDYGVLIGIGTTDRTYWIDYTNV